MANDKENLYYLACERYESLINESQYQKIINVPKKLFVMAYLQGAIDLGYAQKLAPTGTSKTF